MARLLYCMAWECEGASRLWEKVVEAQESYELRMRFVNFSISSIFYCSAIR